MTRHGARAYAKKGYRIQPYTLVCLVCGGRENKRSRVYHRIIEIVPSFTRWCLCTECHELRHGTREDHSLLHTLLLSTLQAEGYEVHASGSPEFWERLWLSWDELMKLQSNSESA